MINLYEYVAPQETIVPKYSLKAAPLNLSNKVYTTIDEFIDSKAKDIIIRKIKEWYEKNPNRKNIKSTTSVGCYLFLDDGKDRLVKDVIKEIKCIGVSGGSGEFDAFDKKYGLVGGQHITDALINFSVDNYKQFKENNYKYTKTFNNDCVIKFQNNVYTNGYNELPTDDMNVIRKKLYDCMTDTTCEIVSNPVHSNGPAIPKFIVYLKAVYDKRKLKNLLTELKNDRRLQEYADRLDSISKGISAYYASKRSGDYTGD